MPKPITLLKAALFAAALVPFGLLVWGFYTNDLTANPGDYITDQTGTWILGTLFASLCITPLRKLTGWNDLIKLRRMLGLFAFFYATLHLLTWIVFVNYFDVTSMVADVFKRPFITVGMTVFVNYFDVPSMVADVFKRPFITVGMAVFIILFLLAITSNRWSIRLLARKWATLHRLVYLAAIGGVIHFWWLVKADITLPRRWAVAFGVLLGVRAWWAYQKRVTTSSTRRVAAAGGR